MISQIEAHRKAENEFKEARARLLMDLPLNYGPEIWDMIPEEIRLQFDAQQGDLIIFGAKQNHDSNFQPPAIVKAFKRHDADYAAKQLDVQSFSLRNVPGSLPGEDDRDSWTRRVATAITGCTQGDGKR